MMNDDGVVSSSTEEERKKDPHCRGKGGWRAIGFILGNESFEKLASMSLIANITVYLRTNYNMNGLLLVNVVNIWSGSSNITTIAGAFLSDALLGRYLTLLIGSISSFLGMGTFALTAFLPQLRPPHCPDEINCTQPQQWQLAILFLGLTLLALGSGGIRPCNIAFGADQFDTNTEKGRSQLKSFFNWWYFSFTIALLIALTVVVYIQTNVSWTLGFTIPTACLALSIIIFLLGSSTYVRLKPQGSVLVDIIKVVNAAWMKRKVVLLPSSEASLYDPPVKEDDKEHYVIPHRDRFKYLDKAAVIVDPSELDAEGNPTNSWRLCNVQQVEKLKCLVGVIPVWFTAIACFISMDQMNTLGILQAIQSNTKLGNFKVPPGWMGLTSMIALALTIFIYECIYVPYAEKKKKRDDVRLSTKQKIQIGIVMSILCMLVAGYFETKRRERALEAGTVESPQSVLFLLPQFALSGLTESFAAVAIMEFFNNQMPPSMRSVAGSIFFLSLSMASYLNSVLVNIVHKVTGANGKTPWLGGADLNHERLEYFYCIIAGLGVINFFYFSFFASNYVFSDVTSASEEARIENFVQPVPGSSNFVQPGSSRASDKKN